MEDNYWEAIAKMFEVANKRMAEMNKTIKEMTATMNKVVKNPLPDYLNESGGGGHNRRKRQLKAAEAPRELFTAMTKSKNYNQEYNKDNGNIQPNTKN